MGFLVKKIRKITYFDDESAYDLITKIQEEVNYSVNLHMYI